MRSTQRPTAGYGRRRPAAALLAILAGTLLAGVVLVTGAGAASAHATLQSSTPSDGQVVAEPPPQVQLLFDEPVEVSLGWLRVYAADGTQVQADRAALGGDRLRVSALLRPGLADGSYLVDWRVTSVDGHPISGSFTFSVGAPGAVAAIDRPTSPDSVRLLVGAGRFLAYAGLAVLVGTLVLLLVCWPAGWASPAAISVVWGALTGTSLASLAAVLLHGAQQAGRGLDGVLDQAVWQTLPSTRLGTATGLRLLVLLAIAAVLRLGVAEHEGRPPTRVVRVLLAVALPGLLASVAMAGHAAAGSATWFTLPVDVLHLAAFSCWLGALPVLAGVVLRLPDPHQVTRAVARFSRLALGCIALLVLTGSIQAWRQIGSVEAISGSVYGRLVLVKVLLLAAVVSLALLSRQWLRSRLAAGSARRGQAAEEAAPASVLARTVGAELTLGVVVVAVTAVLVAVPPGRVSYLPTEERTVAAGPVTVKVRAVPERSRQIDLHVYTYDNQNRPVDLPEVTTQARLPGRDVGPLTLQLAPVGPGHLVADRLRLPLTGTWDVQVYLRTTEIDSYQATASLTVR